MNFFHCGPRRVDFTPTPPQKGGFLGENGRQHIFSTPTSSRVTVDHTHQIWYKNNYWSRFARIARMTTNGGNLYHSFHINFAVKLVVYTLNMFKKMIILQNVARSTMTGRCSRRMDLQHVDLRNHVAAPRSLSHHHPRLLAALLCLRWPPLRWALLYKVASPLSHAVHRAPCHSGIAAMTSRLVSVVTACVEDSDHLRTCVPLRNGCVCVLGLYLFCPTPQASDSD